MQGGRCPLDQRLRCRVLGCSSRSSSSSSISFGDFLNSVIHTRVTWVATGSDNHIRRWIVFIPKGSTSIHIIVHTECMLPTFLYAIFAYSYGIGICVIVWIVVLVCDCCILDDDLQIPVVIVVVFLVILMTLWRTRAPGSTFSIIIIKIIAIMKMFIIIITILCRGFSFGKSRRRWQHQVVIVPSLVDGHDGS